MSFLSGRLAAIEAAHCLQESKKAVNRLANKLNHKFDSPLASSASSSSSSNSSKPFKNNGVENQGELADVLPEILKHNLPPSIYQYSSATVENSSSSPLFRASKWVVQTDTKKNATSLSVDALNPLKSYVSLPQVTLGPKRWHLPNAESSVLASTANELRQDKYTLVNPEKLKAAAAEGLSQIGKAFFCATILVFGGGILTFELVASKLELHNSNDLQTKGKDFVRPRFEKFRKQISPLRTWAEDTSKKWHYEKEHTFKENPLIKELSKTLGAKSSN